MDVKQSVIDAIGNTPLIRLRRASEITGCEIYGKAEFMNPGQSVKDRAALYIVRDAVARGALRPGGVIVEGTAGNTGIGLALVANAMGFRTVIVIPDNQSREKKDTLRIAGAELVEVPPVPYKNSNNYVKVSGRLADELARSEAHGAIWANQFDNVANRRAHYETTGPEIWAQTDGKVDAFVSAVGTGGTLAGVGLALKERNPRIVIGLADPMGAALYSLLHDRRPQGGRLIDHRGNWPGPDHGESARSSGGPGLPDQGPGSRPDRLRPDRRRGAGAWRIFRHQRRRRRSAWRGRWGQGTPSSRSSPTMARATSRSCSIPNFSRRTACRYPIGWRTGRRSKCPM